jgi:hypothetical protein
MTLLIGSVGVASIAAAKNSVEFRRGRKTLFLDDRAVAKLVKLEWRFLTIVVAQPD